MMKAILCAVGLLVGLVVEAATPTNVTVSVQRGKTVLVPGRSVGANGETVLGAGWRVRWTSAAQGVPCLELAFSSPSGKGEIPPRVTVSFDLPVGDSAGLWEPVNHLWTPFAEGEGSKFCYGTPVRCWFADGDENRLVLAWSECVRAVSFSPRLVIEEPKAFVYRVSLGFFTEPEAALTEWRTKVRFDTRNGNWSDRIREASHWVATEAQAEGQTPPQAAGDPVYSTWYAFGNALDAATIESECARASQLGMKTLITDDGWQTTHGDWDPVPEHFPKMREHVDRVHALGMRYVLWYALSFMNGKSRHYESFKGKYLMDGLFWGQHLAILDPRFPEVRRFIVDQLATRMVDWNLDGFKIDFIDYFRVFGEDPAVRENDAGRDIRSIPEAAQTLLAEISTRLRALRPDVLLEFRQPYSGPVTAEYGNMLRANDCPGDALANRVRTTDIRLTADRAVVHSDMLRWSPSDDPVPAVRSILSVIFTAVQYSMVLDSLPVRQRNEIAKWIAFAEAHREALLGGGFRAYNPAANYPLLEGWSEKERIFAVYDSSVVVPVGALDRRTLIINATPANRVLVECGNGVRRLSAEPYGVVTVSSSEPPSRPSASAAAR